jgi:tetratricopeptide (TPR) repeat protein
MPVDDPGIASAIRRHEERLARNPDSLAFAQLADLYRKTGRTREAVARCREGLARFPHYTTARLILAKALAAEGDLDQALAEVESILALSPRDVQGHRLAADLYRRRGDLDAAARHLEEAVGLDPGDRESAALLALLRPAPPPAPEGAERGLGRVLADDTFATVTFGRVCLEQGCLEEAATAFTRVLRKDPGDPEARAGLEATLTARQRRKG